MIVILFFSLILNSISTIILIFNYYWTLVIVKMEIKLMLKIFPMETLKKEKGINFVIKHMAVMM